VEFLLLATGAIIAIAIALHVQKNRRRAELEQSAYALGEIIIDHFLAQPCPRCHESEMGLISVSPNARSIHYRCRNCNKKAHAPASSPDAAAAASRFAAFEENLERFNSRYKSSAVTVEIVFQVPEAPLPYEQTTREPISEAVRSEVWRRDSGKCVKCGSKQSLEFDHIIPVSRGGATSARNLQLLCRSCNRAKSAAI
jgi:hypothetical protein